MNHRYVAIEGIRALDFDDEWVVFNPQSWDAHLLNPAAVVVLELLGSAAQSEQEIEAYLRDVLIEAEKSAAAQHARRLLDELVQLGLAQRIACDVATDR
jgi:PqqD family protein of HPr-rel-A system